MQARLSSAMCKNHAILRAVACSMHVRKCMSTDTLARSLARSPTHTNVQTNRPTKGNGRSQTSNGAALFCGRTLLTVRSTHPCGWVGSVRGEPTGTASFRECACDLRSKVHLNLQVVCARAGADLPAYRCATSHMLKAVYRMLWRCGPLKFPKIHELLWSDPTTAEGRVCYVVCLAVLPVRITKLARPGAGAPGVACCVDDAKSKLGGQISFGK